MVGILGKKRRLRAKETASVAPTLGPTFRENSCLCSCKCSKNGDATNKHLQVSKTKREKLYNF